MILALVFFIVFYTATNVYIGRKLFIWLQLILPSLNGLLFAGIYALLSITPVLAILFANRPLSGLIFKVTSIIGRIGEQWMGVYFYFLLFTVAVDIVFLLARLFRFVSTPIANHLRFFSGLLVLIIVFVFCAYGNYHARKLEEVSYKVSIEKPIPDDGLTVVLISDLHLGCTNGVKALEKIVARINTMNADLVLMAGDLFTGSIYSSGEREMASAILRSIQSQYGSFACLGNHDAGSNFEHIIAFLA